ncbi:MAG: GNAT family N-acetyltransferase [Schwartzia sp.]|nr:GNAT family N-acetyltransferase [Schwartzia sp. (in: firmicutes)]
MIGIKPYAPEHRAAWDAFAAAAKNAHFFFQRGYMEYHQDRFEDASLLFFDEKERLVALLPASRHGEIVVSHGGLTFGGFLTGSRMTAALMLEIVAALKQYLSERGCTEIIYKCLPQIYAAYPAEEDRYALYRSGAGLIRRDVSSAIWLPERYKYFKGRAWMVAKGKKNGVTVRESRDYDAFIALENEVLQKYHQLQAVHTGTELALLAERFPRNIHLYVGELDGRLAAGTVIFENSGVVHTQYMANSDEGRAAGALDRVIDHLITEVYADRQYFDFGISTERDGQYLNEGLITQKEGFGARAVVHDFYRLKLA